MGSGSAMYNIQNKCIAWIHIICVILLINKGSAEACVNKNATQDTQYIYSHPGFNSVGYYPSNTDECWIIHADPAIFGNKVRVQLTMMYFDIEESANCTLDYVKIYSGENAEDSGNSRIIGTYCGYYPTNDRGLISVVSNSSHMYVNFTSDIDKELTGFKFKYKAILLNSHGSITSPVSVNGCYYLEAEAVTQTFYSHEGYPAEKYAILYDACWIIHVSPDVPLPIYYMSTLGVKLWTNDFNIEYNANCARDYVSVYNGDNNVSAPLLNKFCGDITFRVNATDSFMFVHFHSDKSQVFPGFSLTYTTVFVDQDKSIIQPSIPSGVDSCTYLEATDDKKYFTSHPGYGETDYTTNDDACWIIAVATNRSNDVVQVKSKGFELGVKYCRFNDLAFYDGFYYGRAMGRYCNISFHNQASTGKYMTIVLSVSWLSRNFPGFKLEYFAVDASLADMSNEFTMAGWKVALLATAAAVGAVAIAGFILTVVCMDEVKKWWPNRSICRCNCAKKMYSETEPDEVEGACAMNVTPSTTETPNSNTHSKAVQKSRFKNKKSKISADRYRVSDSEESVNFEEEADRPSKKTKKRRQKKVQDSSQINGTVDPPPYATDIEDDPPPPYDPDHIYM